MNQILELKLKELIGEAERQSAPAMIAVLDHLLGAYLEGKQNEFAKHCCTFSPVNLTAIRVRATDNPDDILLDSDSPSYIN